MKDGLYYAEQFQQKKISVFEWIADRETQVKKLNPRLHALVDWDVPGAKANYQKRKPIPGPFFGLPIPLKMLGQEKKGMKSTSGSRLFLKNYSKQTDYFVQAIEAAGLLPLGKTNVPEFGFKNISDAAIYTPARNPWNLDYSPGGSSGGAAAAVASGLFPIAAASDGGGSIRIPASFCGLIGLKPTRGAMPTGPNGWRGWQGASVNFALTVSMRDTETLFYQLRGSKKAAPYHAPRVEWTHQKAADSKPLRIAFLTDSPVGTSVSSAAKQAVDQAVCFLEKQGHQVTEIAYPLNGQQLIESYYLMNGAETAAMFKEVQAGLNRSITAQDMELMTWGIYQYGLKTFAHSYIRALHVWDHAAAVMEDLFQQYDLFLTPTTASTAPKVTAELQSEAIRQRLTQAENLSFLELETLIYEMFEKSLTLSPYTQLANLTGQPAISLPTHLSASGLPLGIQLMASKGREDLLLQIGYVFEQERRLMLPKYYQET